MWTSLNKQTTQHACVRAVRLYAAGTKRCRTKPWKFTLRGAAWCRWVCRWVWNRSIDSITVRHPSCLLVLTWAYLDHNILRSKHITHSLQTCNIRWMSSVSCGQTIFNEISCYYDTDDIWTCIVKALSHRMRCSAVLRGPAQQRNVMQRIQQRVRRERVHVRGRTSLHQVKIDLYSQISN